MEWVVDGKIDTNYVMQKGCDGREEDLALIAKHGTLRGSLLFSWSSVPRRCPRRWEMQRDGSRSWQRDGRMGRTTCCCY